MAGESQRSAIASLERAAAAHARRGAPRVEGRRLALVAVVRDRGAIQDAVDAGADALRLVLPPPGEGGGALHARDVAELVGLGAARGRPVWVSLPGRVSQRQLGRAGRTLWTLRAAGVEAVELADLGLLRLVHDTLGEMVVHAAPALGLRSAAAVALLAEQGVERVVLPTDLTLAEIRDLASRTAVALEVPVHGAGCLALSGTCAVHSAGGSADDRGGGCATCPLNQAWAAEGQVVAGRAALSLVSSLRAAGLAAVQVEPRPGESVRQVVSLWREALDAGPLASPPADEHDEETRSGFLAGVSLDHVLVGAGVSARPPEPSPPMAPPRSVRDEVSAVPWRLAASLKIVAQRTSAEGGEVEIQIRTRLRVLAEVRWPLSRGGAPVGVLDELLRALVPGPNAPLRFETLVRRGDSESLLDARVDDLENRVRALWEAVDAALTRERGELIERLDVPSVADAEDHERPYRVTVTVPHLSGALEAIRRADYVSLPIEALDAPDVDQAVLTPERRARVVVALPIAASAGSSGDLSRRLRRLSDAGFAGVEVHDLTQLAVARQRGLFVVAGAGLPATNREAVALLQSLGCGVATLSPSATTAEWTTLLRARAALPLRAPLYGWPALLATRLRRLPAALGELGVASRQEGDTVVLVRSAPEDRLDHRARLTRVGVAELVIDLRRAPSGVPGTDVAALIARARPPRDVEATRRGLATERDSKIEHQLGILYGTADRLTKAFRERHGLACSPDCARCCAQLVPVWPIEAAALIPGIRELARTNAEQRALRQRAEEQLAEQSAELKAAGIRRHPSEMSVWRVQPGQLDPLVGQPWPPCVLLSEGRCQVYTRRPLLCRLYGFPTSAIPGNLCRRLAAPLLDRPAGSPLPSIPARHVARLGASIRHLQGLPDGVTDMTTVAAIVAHALR